VSLDPDPERDAELRLTLKDFLTIEIAFKQFEKFKMTKWSIKDARLLTGWISRVE